MPVPEATPWGTGTAGIYYFFDQAIAAAGRANVAGVVTDATPAANPLAVIPNTGMTVTVNAGAYRQAPAGSGADIGGGFGESFLGGTVTLAAADPVYPRVDYVSIWQHAGTLVSTLVATTGVPDNSSPLPTVPIPETRAAGQPNVVLALVIVYPGMTTVTDEHIYDRRFFLPTTFTGSATQLATAQLASSGPDLTPAGKIVIWNADRNLDNSGVDIASIGSGSGDVVGPATAVDSEVALYDGVTGKLLKRGAGTGPARLTSGVLGTGATDLASEVTGDLPLTNVAPAAAGSTLLGRGDAGAGDWQAVALGTNLTMSGTTLNATGGAGGGDFVGPAASVDSEVVLFSGTTGKLGKRSTGTGVTRIASGVQSAAELSGDVTTSGSNATTIASNAVTLGKMQDIGQDRVLGRVAAGSGDPQELTAAQMLTLLGLSGGANLRTVLLASNATVTASTTSVKITGMTFTGVDTGFYLALYALFYTSDTAGTGIRYGLSHTGAASVAWNSMVAGAAGAHDQDLVTPGNLTGSAARSLTSPTAIISVSVDTVSANMLAWIFAHIQVASGTGDLELFHACEVGTGSITTGAGTGAMLLKLG